MTDNQEYLEKLFREFYYFEHSRKARINTDRSIPIAILTVISGVLIYYAQIFPVIGVDLISILFIVFAGGAVFSIIRSILFLKKTFFNYDYDYVISPNEIDHGTSDLRDYYNQIETENIEDTIIDDIHEMIINQYKEHTNNNIKSNDSKQYDVNMSLTWIFRAIVFMILSMLPFYFLNNQNDHIQKVEIIKHNSGVGNDGK